MGFFLLLRKCNLVPDSTPKFDAGKQLTRNDIQFFEDHAKVTLRWTKTRQSGNKPLSFALPCIQNSLLCPVTALKRLFALVPTDPSKSCFLRTNGTCYTYAMLQKKLSWISDKLGLEEKLTSHSLRSGGATMAFLAGVPSELIKILGDWKSDCYLKYIRLPLTARLAASALMKYRVQMLEN